MNGLYQQIGGASSEYYNEISARDIERILFDLSSISTKHYDKSHLRIGMNFAKSVTDDQLKHIVENNIVTGSKKVIEYVMNRINNES